MGFLIKAAPHRTLQRLLIGISALAVSSLAISGCSGGFTPRTSDQTAPNAQNRIASVLHPAPQTFAEAWQRARENKTRLQPVPNVFAQAAGRTLRAADLDVYISPSIKGARRALMRKFMLLEAPNARGDLVYYTPDGKVLSNNAALVTYIKVTHLKQRTARSASPTSVHSSQTRLSSAHRMHPNYWIGPCSPPNPPGINPMGVYLRQQSLCGSTAGWSFVNLPCGYSSFYVDSNGVQQDKGFLYMELRGGNGSLSEGGIQVNDGNDPQGMQAYSTLGTSKLNNESAHYDCGTDMGVMVGATYNGQYAYVEVGVLPQGTTPETNFYDGNEFTLQNASWFFYNSPGDLNVSPGTDAAGIKTPCTLCSINRVTSIGENNLPNGQFFRYDGSYFGVDFVSGSLNADKIHWMQNAFGDWESDCVPPPTGTLCTFDYPLNPLETYGGAYAYPNDQVAHSSMSPVGMGPYETYDSVNLTCNGCTYNFKAKTFSEPYPPNAPSAPIPGPLKVYPETIYYPEKGNHLANCGTNQPKDPNQAGTVDPDAPFDETISFDSNGCELLNGSPDNQVSNHSVHIHEDNYYGDFVVSSVSPGCGASLSVPVIERNPGPDAWVQMNGTPNVTSSVSCTVHIMGYKGYNINVTVNMGY